MGEAFKPLGPENSSKTTTFIYPKTVRDAGEDEGELERMAADLGRAEGVLYLCKLLRRFKIGTNAIESEAAKMWSETCQRSVGAKDKEKERSKRNVRVVMEKVETLRKEAAICVKEGRLRFEEKVKKVFKERGIRLGSRRAKNQKLKLEGERVKAYEEDKVKKEDKVAHLRKKYGDMERVNGGKRSVEEDEDRLRGIRWSDVQLEGMDGDNVKKEDLVEAGVVIDDDEWEVLKLPPKMAVYEKMERIRMKMDMEEANAKQR